jgi:hypothetical protein
VRYSGARVVERRVLLVTSVLERRGDYEIRVYWGQGAGEVYFSLAKGYPFGARGQRQPWRLEPSSTRAMLAACEPEIGTPAICRSPLWWGNQDDPPGADCAG